MQVPFCCLHLWTGSRSVPPTQPNRWADRDTSPRHVKLVIFALPVTWLQGMFLYKSSHIAKNVSAQVQNLTSVFCVCVSARAYCRLYVFKLCMCAVNWFVCAVVLMKTSGGGYRSSIIIHLSVGFVNVNCFSRLCQYRSLCSGSASHPHTEIPSRPPPSPCTQPPCHPKRTPMGTLWIF